MLGNICYHVGIREHTVLEDSWQENKALASPNWLEKGYNLPPEMPREQAHSVLLP